MTFNYSQVVTTSGIRSWASGPRARRRWAGCFALALAVHGRGAAADGEAAPTAGTGSGPAATAVDRGGPAAPAVRGAIAGRVVQAAGGARPAAGATVVIDDATGEVRRVETDAQGRFR